eukprot:CAMPEP_0116036010 /NCGR_PEP_ID=MMETSP0321-20121206/20829_1 /TAXON_ID=163516 /ORGANISM="Leptocylindrus danicus var. danicus, Strain B650" /LENGTH=470 /DNA_ID=CAMNT_0003513193 /DNA_START=256 /DNA_END=1668 /DNA_ORIENTATION=-
MPGLSFLSKKSWHTSNISNQEKVWMAEQKAAAEEAKTKELAKQIQAEREKEEMERITGKKSLDTGIDWMYQGGVEAKIEQEKRLADEYLLGKEITGSTSKATEEVGGTSANIKAEQLFLKKRDNEIASASNISDAGNERDDYDDFVRRHEDPMYLVSQRRKELKDNQSKKDSLIEKVMGRDRFSASQRESDNRIEHSHRRSTSSRKMRKHDKESSSKRDRKKKEKNTAKDTRIIVQEAEVEAGVEVEVEVEVGVGADVQALMVAIRDVILRKMPENTAVAVEVAVAVAVVAPILKEKHSRVYVQNTPRDEDKSFHRPEKYVTAVDETHPSSPSSYRFQGYGLQGKDSTRGKYTSTNIGPDPVLLSQKRKEKVARMASGTSAGSRRGLSAEEKANALREMKTDAHVREAAIEVAVKSKLRGDKTENEVSGNAVFLTEMANKAHGFDSEVTLRDRLTSKRHTSQRTRDDKFL